MRNNDVIFFNLHRRYTNTAPQFGGFIGTFILAAVMKQNAMSPSFAGTVMEGKRLIDEACQAHKVSVIGLYCDYENVTENISYVGISKRRTAFPSW